MKKLITVAALLLFANTCLAEMISVTHQPADLRNQAMVAGSTVISKLKRHTPLEVLAIESDYYQVKTADGTTGYIHKSYTGKVPAIIVTGATCNVRNAPGTEFPVVFKAYRGDTYKILDRQNDWLQIKNTEGQMGWLWKDLAWGD